MEGRGAVSTINHETEEPAGIPVREQENIPEEILRETEGGETEAAAAALKFLDGLATVPISADEEESVDKPESELMDWEKELKEMERKKKEKEKGNA